MMILTRRAFAAALSLLATLCITPALAAPEPDAIPSKWQLDLKPGPVRVVSLENQKGEPRVYAFFTYRVTNNTGNDLSFIPAFDLATEEASFIRSGQNVPADVTAQVITLLSNDFILDQISMLGTLQQGPENAKDGVVIWPLPDMDTDRLTIYAAGFSGESKSVTVTNPTTGDRERKTLRKVRALHYETPGDIVPSTGRALTLINDEWIMR